ncbi:MAG: ferrous iron transport protein B, partial [Clostridiales Family XIII bacterium]|nr:ferrous iron transport protein B [Clostridiales Family XIII bacterium]
EGKAKIAGGGVRDVTIVDLPGIYSLAPYSPEEIVTRDFLVKEHPDGIINIVDIMNIERGLYLSLQLMQMGIPMVIALNMMDELQQNGGSVDVERMQKDMGLPVVPISAANGDGVEELLERTVAVAIHGTKPEWRDYCTGPVHRAIHGVRHLIEDHAQAIGIPDGFAATKLIERDEPLFKALHLTDHEAHTIEEAILDMETEYGSDRKAAIADMRYAFIGDVVAHSIVKPHMTIQHSRSIRIDSLLTHKYLGIPIFLGIMLLIFWLTFGLIGSALSDGLSNLIALLGEAIADGMAAAGINPIMQSLVSDGAFAGVGSVLSFIPMIVLMFLFMSLLEDSGYMARVAFIMDRLLRKIGLSGRSFVPMLLGFGCSVPAIMATRTLSSERDRKMTILLTPFMSCTAKLPIYAVFTAAFFEHHRALVMISLYILGIVVGILVGLLFKKTAFRGKPVPFILELPHYRMPDARSVAQLLWIRTKDFLQRAFTIIFVASIVIWFLQSFDVRFNPVEFGEDSMLAAIGTAIAPVFAPLGFGNWFSSTALLTGFMAKEAVISTMAVLTGQTGALLPVSLGALFTPLTAYVFLVFILLYTPCVAAITVVRKEMNSTLIALGVVVFQCVVAWICAFIVYRIGLLLF